MPKMYLSRWFLMTEIIAVMLFSQYANAQTEVANETSSTLMATTPAELDPSFICGGDDVRIWYENDPERKGRNGTYNYWHNSSNEVHCFFELPDHPDFVVRHGDITQKAEFFIDGARARCAEYSAYLPRVTNGRLYWAIKDAVFAVHPGLERYNSPLGIYNWTLDGVKATVTWDNGAVTVFENVSALFNETATINGDIQTPKWIVTKDSISSTFFRSETAGPDRPYSIWVTYASDIHNEDYLVVLCHQNITGLKILQASSPSVITTKISTTSPTVAPTTSVDSNATSLSTLTTPTEKKTHTSGSPVDSNMQTAPGSTPTNSTSAAPTVWHNDIHGHHTAIIFVTAGFLFLSYINY